MILVYNNHQDFSDGSDGNPPAMQETQVQSLGWEDPLEKGMATHSSILLWKIPWTEEPAGYSPWGHKESDGVHVSTGSQRVRHD